MTPQLTSSSFAGSNIFSILMYIKDGNLHIIDESSSGAGSSGSAGGSSDPADQSIDRSLVNSGLIIEGFTNSEDTIERLIIANDNTLPINSR